MAREKEQKTKEMNDNILTLRQALFEENGRDKGTIQRTLLSNSPNVLNDNAIIFQTFAPGSLYFATLKGTGSTLRLPSPQN